MVRYCIVPNCKENDSSTLAHRFPKKLDHRKKWQEALNLQEYDLDVLLSRYVVCVNHFKPSDYRNPISKHLNTTAIPHLPLTKAKKEGSPEKRRDSTVEIVDVTENEVYRDVPESNRFTETGENPDPVKIIFEETFSQRRRKRTNEEVGEEIKQLTEAALKKIKAPPEFSSSPEIKISNENFIIEPGPIEEYIEEEKLPSSEVTYIKSEVPNIVEIVLVEAACQTEDTEEKDESEFSSLSRTELIKMLKEKDQTIETLQKKIGKFEAAMSAFKVLMNPLD